MKQRLIVHGRAEVDVVHIVMCSICNDCVKSMNNAQRDTWIADHRAETGHECDAATEITVITP